MDEIRWWVLHFNRLSVTHFSVEMGMAWERFVN